MLDLETLINENEFEKLKQAIINKNVIKIKANNEILNKIYNIDKLNNHLNKNILVYPYISLNNHHGNTCKHDLIKRTKNKHINSLETKLSKKNILFRIAQGDTLVINYLQEFDNDVESLINYFSNKFNSNCNINLYYSYKNTLGINLHFDLHDILAIQFHGKKEWVIVKQKGNVSQIIEKSKIPRLSELNEKDIENIETNIGDILYIPKGIWHQAKTTDKSSLHFALSLNPLRVKDLIKYFLNTSLENLGERNLYDISSENIKKELQEVLEKLDKCLNSYLENDSIKLLSNLSISENVNLKLS